MERTPPPTSLAAALALPRAPGRSAEVFVDGDLEVRFAARPTDGPQVPHQRDELYIVAAGTGRYRVENTVTEVGPGDVLFCAAHVAHGFEDISATFPCGCCSTARGSNRGCHSKALPARASACKGLERGEGEVGCGFCDQS